MTLPLQDDAAERRIRQLANDAYNPALVSRLDLTALFRAAWTEATEAAAKKCEAQKVKTAFGVSEGVVEAYDNACEDCAAAIRGNK